MSWRRWKRPRHPKASGLLSLSVHGVKTRVNRARSFLRKELGHVMATLEATPAPQGKRGRDAQGRLLADRDQADVASCRGRATRESEELMVPRPMAPATHLHDVARALPAGRGGV